jgi:hypothetical protein
MRNTNSDHEQTSSLLTGKYGNDADVVLCCSLVFMNSSKAGGGGTTGPFKIYLGPKISTRQTGSFKNC